jgi:hypothetical protein
VSGGSSSSGNSSNFVGGGMSNVSNVSSSNNSDFALDFTPEKYPQKFRKFVAELPVLVDTYKLANEMIDNVDPKGELDEGVRSIVSYMKDLERNLVM